MGIRLGALEYGAAPRKRLREILEATAVFKDEEVNVALELFEESQPSADEAFVAPYEFIGAFDQNDELVGYACFGATPGTDRTYDLYWIAMHPDVQGSGGGTTLLEGVEQQLARRRARLIIVETSSRPEYAATRRFYERRGYHPAARMRDFYAAGDDRLVFTKRFH
jgi:ribosomal protein S18 acetylase RimI-like enzyme